MLNERSCTASVFRSALVAAVLLMVHAVLLGWGAYVHSPTLNEPAHLVAGIDHWESARFDLYRVNPPLVRMVAAMPVMLAGANEDWGSYHDAPGARPEFALGEAFVAANGERSFWLFTLSRWACIPFSLLGGYICYRWAGKLYGPAGGLLALTLWCFCPNILAHAQLITPDVPAAALGIAAGYTFWRWLQRPSWTRTVVSGLVLGAAELAKMTLVIFYVIWPLLWLVYRWPNRRAMHRRDWLRELGMLVVRTGVAVYVINLGYAFEGSCKRLGDHQFVSATLAAPPGADSAPAFGGNRFRGTWLGTLPVPLPKNYVLGADLQKRDFEKYDHPSYLRGQFSRTGWWYFYLYALAIKVPLGTWLLVFIAAIRGGRATGGARWRDEMVVLAPALLILTFVSAQTGFSLHMRYVLPVFPFVFVWVGRLAMLFERRARVAACLCGGALAWSVGSSLWAYPHSLSYFNELVGGPAGGAEHLIHSNLDWGQDLLALRRWMDEHPEARPLKLAYFGYFDPRHAGIEYKAPLEMLGTTDQREAPSGDVPSGWYAMSVNFVRGFPYHLYTGDGSKVFVRRGALARFQEMKPVAQAGYSIYIYHVPEP